MVLKRHSVVNGLSMNVFITAYEFTKSIGFSLFSIFIS